VSAPDRPRLIVVAGPTGTGKSDLGLDIAQRLDGEVVNADSMQLYRGMDIGTAKLPVAERRGIPHVMVVPSVVLTLLFGPLGLLSYIVLRGLVRRHWALRERE